MLKEKHTKGSWTVELEETGSDPKVEGYITNWGRDMSASIAAMAGEGVVTDHYGEKEFAVPEDIQDWAMDLEDAFCELIDND